MKYMQEFIHHFKENNAFTIRDARIFLKSKKISNTYLKVFIHLLLKKKKLNAIRNGVYTFQQDPIAIGFGFEPFYYGLHYALSIHQLWDQATNLVIITPKKYRSGMREIMETNVIVRRINPKFFFGYEMKWHSGMWIPVSTIEKTFADFIYFKEKIPGQVWEEWKKQLNRKILYEILAPYPIWVKKRIKKLMNAKEEKK